VPIVFVIVFVIVPDPVSAGFVDSLARPGGNATGFLMFEYGISAKWLELLKKIAPGVMQVAVLRDPALTASVAQRDPVRCAVISRRADCSQCTGCRRLIASSLRAKNRRTYRCRRQPNTSFCSLPREIERGITNFARASYGRVPSRPFEPVILDLERDIVGVGGDQAGIRDGDAAGVTREVGETAFGPAKGRLE